MMKTYHRRKLCTQRKSASKSAASVHRQAQGYDSYTGHHNRKAKLMAKAMRAAQRAKTEEMVSTWGPAVDGAPAATLHRKLKTVFPQSYSIPCEAQEWGKKTRPVWVEGTNAFPSTIMPCS